MSGAGALVDAEIDARGGTVEVVKTLHPWPPLQRLPELAPETPAPFPFEALGPVIGGAAEAIARDVQAPDALAAGSTLAASSLAAMAHADVVMPHGQRAPLSLYMCTAVNSGERKSATDSVASQEVERARREQARQYLEERAAASDDAIPAPPRSLTVSKATIEGLQLILRNQSTVGVFTAEGGEFLAGHSMREERRSAGLAWMLKAWGGETLDALTRGDGLSILLGRRVAMHVMVQPVLMRQLLSDPLAQGQGLLARCLIAQPNPLAGTRLFRDVDASASPEVRTFNHRLRHLLSSKPAVLPGGDGYELDLLQMGMDQRAKAAWIDFYNEIEVEQAPGNSLACARAFASKTAEHAARIAGVIQILTKPEVGTVTAEAMQGGIEVARFYLGEHVRLTGAGTQERQLTLLHSLLDWMTGRGRTVAHRDVLQRGPNPVRQLKADGIGKLLDELAVRGYIRRAHEAWEIRHV